MVEEMANRGAAGYRENGDGDTPTAESKGDLSGSDSSGSENTGTSTEESSAEEEDDEEEDTNPGGCPEDGDQQDEEADPGIYKYEAATGSEALNGGDESRFKICCEKCKAAKQQNQSFELVAPRMVKGRLQVQLEAEGTYQCSVTGLVFEASERVLVRYSVLSWSRFGSFLRDSWKFAGPIFNVDTVNKDASVLKSIQFPHSLCLADPDDDMTFGVLHIKDKRPLIEPTADHSGSHVKWNVTSLSPVGPVVQMNRAVGQHGVVLVYKQCGSDASYSFHVYLAPNSSSDIKDVTNQVRSYKNRFFQITKPPTCHLDEGTYRLLSEPEGEIKPQELKFTLAVTKMKGYFEAFFEQRPPFKLSLIEVDTEETVWSATIREGDCVDNSETRPRKRTSSRQRSSSPSEEELSCKKPRWEDQPDGGRTPATPGQNLSEKQLLLVAKRLGKEWKQVAIFLGLSSQELDDIQAAEKDVTMQKLKMLVEWKTRSGPGKATATHLWNCLKDLDELQNDLDQLLQGMMKNQSAQ